MHLRRFAPTFALLATTLLVGCASSDDSETEEIDTTGEGELEEAPPPGKEDGVGIRGLAVNGNYADTQAWTVLNQWEDKSTTAAKKAGMAWPANSGLTWEEKFVRWIESLEVVAADTSPFYKTIRITTPWGKVLPSPKVDCADAALMLRASFAAWYNLPFVMTAGANPTVHFGHFGARTATGKWAPSINIARVYRDFSATPPATLANWPTDSRLRKMHIHGTNANGNYLDEIPYYLGKGEGTGAFLDEMHLNKRAARLIMYLMINTGSRNLADSNNTYNASAESLRIGDTLVFRRAPNGSGHTMIMLRVRSIDGGQKEAQNIFGNEPPAQLYLESPSATRANLMNNQGGGVGMSGDGVTPYAKIGGGLKRFRVAKAVNGYWRNTWMEADKASWIDADDTTKISERPAKFGALLGQLNPQRMREELLAQVELKREHLRNNPSSCSARSAREEVFDRLISHNATYFGKTAEQTERQYRTVEDYVYAPLVYSKSRTCCWNSSNRQTHETVMNYVAEISRNGCVAPPAFKQTAGRYAGYEEFAASQGLPFAQWRADEECLATTLDDTVEPTLAPLIPWCQ